MKTIFTEEHINFMKENYTNMSYLEIANTLGFTERQVRGKINNMGLTKLRKINDNYFNKIDTPLKAYLLGFIYADGWISYNINNRTYEFGMELQSQDKYVLDCINNEIGGNNHIKHYDSKEITINGVNSIRGEMDRLRIFSKNIVFDLERHGIVKNKTKSNIYPIVNENLFFDFLRGYIDGDGCYYINNGNINVQITCSSEVPLIYIQDVLDKHQIKSSVYRESDKKYRLMCYDKNSVNNLVNCLYYADGLFCLERKYNKIKTLINGFAT